MDQMAFGSWSQLLYGIPLIVAGALIPFLVMSATCFVKLVVVFGLVRNALGIQQIPPNMAINSIVLMLTIYVMMPVINEMVTLGYTLNFDIEDPEGLMGSLNALAEPYRQFLLEHTKVSERQFFIKAAEDLWPQEYLSSAHERNLVILLPSFAISELTEAFQIGFLIYLPFVVVDLIISNILLALGMMMVSPMTISLPFKLLLFVLVDGWSRLIHGVIVTY